MNDQIPDEARQYIGKTKTREYDISKKDIRRFAQAIGEMDPIYYDDEYAKTTKFESIVAPPLFCHSFSFEDVPPDRLSSDGSPIETDIPLPAKRLVGGGSIFENYIRLRPGDIVIVKTEVKDIYTKQGKSGILYFIVIETIFFNQNKKLVAKETSTFIKRI